jgi:hypothetical protein
MESMMFTVLMADRESRGLVALTRARSSVLLSFRNMVSGGVVFPGEQVPNIKPRVF